jgi:hypothetical protein
MSLLSDTNYSPQRIYALVRLLEANDGRLNFAKIRDWLKPAVRGIDLRASAEDPNIRQLIGATTSLGMIDSPAQNEYQLTSPVPDSIEGFADAVHDRLVALGPDHADSIVLEAYAATVVLTEKSGGTSWLGSPARDRAAQINAAVQAQGSDEGEEERNRFNATKYAPWKRWMIFLGLGTPITGSDLYPYPTRRLEREIARLRADNGVPDSLEVEVFNQLIAARMPYLDNGGLFRASVDRVRLPPLGRRLSRTFSGALRDLHDDQRLTLESIGDSRDTHELAQEPHPVKSIKRVTLRGPASHD